MPVICLGVAQARSAHRSVCDCARTYVRVCAHAVQCVARRVLAWCSRVQRGGTCVRRRKCGARCTRHHWYEAAAFSSVPQCCVDPDTVFGTTGQHSDWVLEHAECAWQVVCRTWRRTTATLVHDPNSMPWARPARLRPKMIHETTHLFMHRAS